MRVQANLFTPSSFSSNQASRQVTASAQKNDPKFSGGLGILPEVFHNATGKQPATTQTSEGNKKRLDRWI